MDCVAFIIGQAKISGSSVMMISYAQNFEDVILMRVFHHIERGNYVDVGAHHPVEDSISLAFYERGWRGVHVEPLEAFAAALKDARPDETVVQAVVRRDPSPMMFYRVGETGMATGVAEIAAEHIKAGWDVSAVLVESRTLADVLAPFRGQDVHWMKIDVEGMEQDVLESWSASDVRPWIVLLESTKPNSPELNHHYWENIIISYGYTFAYFDGLNRFYVSNEHLELLPRLNLPPNYFDNFSVTPRSIFARVALQSLNALQAELQAATAAAVDARHRLTESELELVRLAGAEATVADLTAQLGSATQQVEASHARVTDIEATAAELRSRLTAATLQAETAQQGLSEAAVLVADLRGQIASAVSEADLVSARTALADMLSLSRAAQAGADAQIDDLRRRLSESDTQLRHSDAQLRETLISTTRKVADQEAAYRGLQARTGRELADTRAEIQAQAEATAAANRSAAEAFATQTRIEQALAAVEAQRDLESRHHADIARQLADARFAISSIHASTSWQVTRPLRGVSGTLRRGLLGATAWLTLRPGSRPRRIMRPVVGGLAGLLAANSATKALAEAFLSPFPGLKSGLRNIVRTHFARRAGAQANAMLPPTIGVIPAANGPAPQGEPVRAELLIYADHTATCPTNTGVQRVVRGLSRALLLQGRSVLFVKWDSVQQTCRPISLAEREHLAAWNGPPLSDAERDLYHGLDQRPDVTLITEASHWLIVPEVTHLTTHATPPTAALLDWAGRSGLRCGFVYYDAIPLRRPEFAAMAKVHATYMHDLRRADVIWPISQFSADELVRFWSEGADPSPETQPRIAAIHLPPEFDRPRALAPTAGEKLILSVGTLEPRKNQLALIRAFAGRLTSGRAAGWRLVLVGNLHPQVAAEVQAATLAHPEIAFLGHVSDEALSDLYARSAFTAFPSLDEGFGLPILESLWYGKPCLCADFGAMGEVASGGGCLTANVRDPDQLAVSLARLMEDADLRARLTQEALDRPMSGWTQYIQQMKLDDDAPHGAIYFWVDSTISFPGNTGIQRVARQLARGLIENGQDLIPVKWGGVANPFSPVNREELEHFARWNGPAVDSWQPWVPLGADGSGGCFLMTELPLNLSDPEQQLLRHTAKVAGLQTTAVFYDAIPWKMRAIYPEPFWKAHRLYMREIANYDTVLSISDYSREELVRFLGDEFDINAAALGHVSAVPLAGEFAERSDSVRERAHIPGNERASKTEGMDILCVGTIEPRKNHERLLDAFELIQATSRIPLRLTLVGGGHSIEPDLAVRVRRRVDANPAMVWEDGASDTRIEALQQSCDFAVYPSLEEGFGLPILESLAYGKPVICANFGSMREVAADGGGCLMVDVRDVQQLAHAMETLANAPDHLERLSAEARRRRFKTWRDYASDVAAKMGLERSGRSRSAGHPRLSVCISTYNRAEWLTTALRNLERLYPAPIPGVEFVVCDNASTDHTPEVVRPYLTRPDVVYRRNPENVGMLGNLRETSRATSGDYIWILGDDDLVLPGAVERVLDAIETHPDASLVYLNYAFTRIDDARTVTDFDQFFAEATPIVPSESDLVGPIREICAQNENFFTAIYTLVFKREHGLRAYDQDTSGRPFSTMLTCIPTTHYVLHNMMEEKGVWLGAPQVVVNMNVSWMRYAPLWILERIPEVYEVALAKGVRVERIDRWRSHTLPGMAHFFREIFENDPLNNAAYVSPRRVIGRFRHLPDFATFEPTLREIYSKAHSDGHPAASVSPDRVFG
jgi:FkbM family methyltransferase